MAKTTVKKSDLLGAVAFCSAFIEKKTTIRVLNGILIEGSGDKLTATGTDLDVSVRAPIKASGEEVRFCIPGIRLLNYVRLLPDCDLEIETFGNDWVEVRHPKGRARFAGLDPTGFPSIPVAAGEDVCFPLKELAAAIKRVGISVSNEEIKFTVKGSLLELSSEGVAMIGTDGHRLSWHRMPLPGIPEINPVVLPLRAMAAVSKMAEASGSELASFSVQEAGASKHLSSNYVFFEADGYSVVSRGIEANAFPNYRKVLPATFSGEIMLPRIDLLDALRRTVARSDDSSRKVTLAIEDGALSCLAAVSSLLGEEETADSIPVDFTGPALTIGVNGRYVLDYLSTSHAEKICFRFNGSAKAMEFGDAGSPDSRYVVMPMRG